MIRVLTFTTLYPNAAQPVHGVFVENRIRRLAESGEVAVEVVAPVPWFPCQSARFGRYAAFARAPRDETRFGLRVQHPRYPTIPKLGMSVAPTLLYRAMRPVIAKLLHDRPDIALIDAHYFYPDGVAAVQLARYFGLPVVVTARGSDINILPRFRSPRRQIVAAGRNADGLIAVCQDLKDKLIALGLPAERAVVLRNGVDLDQFRVQARDEIRARLGLDGPTLLSVGSLVPLKGFALTIRALAELPGFLLLIVGSGGDRERLEALALQHGVADRVRFLGRVPHTEMPELYAAADALVLASSSEGWANVLLESMACGTPVIATAVGGTPEVVADPAAGVLIRERSVQAIVEAVRKLFAAPPGRARTRAYAEQFDWDATTEGQIRLFREILDRHGRRPL